jgi:predicted dehydrogenase
MADKVRIGVIGTGQIGKRHVQRYSEIPEAELVALCDIRGDEVARVAQMHDDYSIYLDFHELLARDDIQSVHV